MDKSSINVKAVLLSNIQLIIDNRETFKKNYKLEINEDSFDHPNNKAAFCILHYLMYKLYPKMSKNAFSNCWPIKEKAQESEFRKTIVSILEKASNEFPTFKFPKITNSALVTTYGTRFCVFIIKLTTVLLQKELNGIDECTCFPELFREDNKTYKKIHQKQSKNYVNLNCQKISKELALQNKLDTFWRESISHFENIFLKYTQELKDLKNQQEECLKQTLNISSDQFMSYKKVEENYCYFKEMMKSLQNNSTNKMLESLVENNPQHAFRLSDHNIDESINNLSNCFKNIQLKDNDFLQEFENSENFTSLSTEIINKLKILDKIMIDIQSLFPDINDKITHI